MSHTFHVIDTVLCRWSPQLPAEVDEVCDAPVSMQSDVTCRLISKRTGAVNPLLCGKQTLVSHGGNSYYRVLTNQSMAKRHSVALLPN